MADRLRLGVFFAPYNAVVQDPTETLARDMELLVHLDRVGYDQAWIGEHHSGGVEVIASPELFIAAAAERTRHIRLGTGVLSLPYHHPLMVADRMTQLDHMTRGRAMMGVGPGALVSDAFMMGIDPADQRRRMNEGLEAVIRLMRGETVSMETDWFKLCEARLQFPPYTRPHIEMAVAAARSPAGASAAGKWGLGMLSIGGTSDEALEYFNSNWEVYRQCAAQNGHPADRRKLGIVASMHVAPTREQAFEDVKFGIDAFMTYLTEVTTFGAMPQGVGDAARFMVESGLAVIGSPDDAVRHLQRLWDATGEFGVLLLVVHDWADWEQTKRSYELIARYVMPQFNGHLDARRQSFEFCRDNRARFLAAAETAVQSEIRRHQQQGRGHPKPDE
jgi:limonene 1,2-monooxygenase